MVFWAKSSLQICRKWWPHCPVLEERWRIWKMSLRNSWLFPKHCQLPCFNRLCVFTKAVWILSLRWETRNSHFVAFSWPKRRGMPSGMWHKSCCQLPLLKRLWSMREWKHDAKTWAWFLQGHWWSVPTRTGMPCALSLFRAIPKTLRTKRHTITRQTLPRTACPGHAVFGRVCSSFLRTTNIHTKAKSQHFYAVGMGT